MKYKFLYALLITLSITIIPGTAAAVCTDADSDGFSIEGGSCGPVDCNDSSTRFHPGSLECSISSFPADFDCDGFADYCDVDGDLYPHDVDCNDADPAINPGATEICGNSIDENCDGALCDGDGDGYQEDVDCNDADPAIHPGATEICGDTIDNDCNGLTDGNEEACGACIDNDGDGFSRSGGDCGPVDCYDDRSSMYPGSTEFCPQTGGFDVNCNGDYMDDNCDADADGYTWPDDCNESDPAINISATEICGNSIDENCDGALCDGDSDGYEEDVDCNDADPAIHPGATEVCDDTIDNDCNGLTDGNDEACGACIDNDGDGFSSTGGSCGPVDCYDTRPRMYPGSTEFCPQTGGFDVNCNGDYMDDNCDADADGYTWPDDCNESDPAINISATEICGNSIDENCDGALCDGDGDGYEEDVDCNDADGAVYPGAAEICDDTIDNDCNGLIDSGDEACGACIDADGDGFSRSGGACGPVDCNDLRPFMYPGSTEFCSNGGGFDTNCNGDDTDDFCNLDGDGDGYTRDADCNDSDPFIYPLSPEICNDTADNDCNGLIDCQDTASCSTDPTCFSCTDVDGDGSFIDGGECGPIDCNDSDAGIHPAAVEDCADSVDNDCDYEIDCADANCAGDPIACPTSGPEVCDDLFDNDQDGKVDCADKGDCRKDPACSGGGDPPADPEICDDEIDNDGDNKVDCSDRDCRDDAACSGGGDPPANPEICDDQIDNDGDGKTDCADKADCRKDPAC